MAYLTELLFGCWHTHYTFPQMDKANRKAYVCCLDCGHEYEYDWRLMKVVGPRVKPKDSVEIPDAVNQEA